MSELEEGDWEVRAITDTAVMDGVRKWQVDWGEGYEMTWEPRECFVDDDGDGRCIRFWILIVHLGFLRFLPPQL
jgi:hypothetical protein